MSPRYLLLLPLFAIAAHADPLKPADKEALLERLDKLSDAADAKIDARFKVAVTAFRAALASDTATMDLYLKCVEKVQYEDNYKKSQDFREWKRKESDMLEKPGFRAALHHQLVWLLLTMEAASTKGKPPGMNAKMETEVDAVYADADKLKDGHDQLSRPATDTVFAKAYDITDLHVQDWPQSPTDLNNIFNRNLIAQYRFSTKIPELRAEWAKWIKYESIAVEKWGNTGNGGPGPGGPGGREEDKRVGMKDAMRSPDIDKFMAEKYPEMLWDLEVDAFRSGDQQAAAVKMVAHLEKYVGHTKAPIWNKQLRKLISGQDDEAPARKPSAPAATSAPAPTATAGTPASPADKP